MKYYKEIKTKEGFTLSIDMVTIDYSISSSAARDELAKILDNLPLLYAVEVRHWSSLRIGTFRENFVLKFQDQTSFWLGVGLNAHKPLWGRSRIEFNPNKVANHKVFLELLGWFNIHSLRMNSIIKRFDLAIDIPFGRQSVRLSCPGSQLRELTPPNLWTSQQYPSQGILRPNGSTVISHRLKTPICFG